MKRIAQTYTRFVQTYVSTRALSIQQKLPVQIFGIFAGRMERVRPLPRIRCLVPCNTGHAGWPFVVFENGGLFEYFRGFDLTTWQNGGNRTTRSKLKKKHNYSSNIPLLVEGSKLLHWCCRNRLNVVRHKTTRRALICSYGRNFCECPCELTLGRETKTEISCEWNTTFSIIPEIPLKRVHSKRIPKFSKTFTGIFTVPFSFGPAISEILVEWKAPQVFVWKSHIKYSDKQKYEATKLVDNNY